MMLESLLRRQVSSTSGPTAIDDFEPDVATFLTPLRAMLTEAARRGQSRDADPQAIAYWFVVVDCSRAAVPPLSLPSRCCRVHALRGGGGRVRFGCRCCAGAARQEAPNARDAGHGDHSTAGNQMMTSR